MQHSIFNIFGALFMISVCSWFLYKDLKVLKMSDEDYKKYMDNMYSSNPFKIPDKNKYISSRRMRKQRIIIYLIAIIAAILSLFNLI